MLRSAALLAVRKQEYNAARLPPLRFRRRDKLVDHDLRPVGEIPVLRLPQHQRERIGDAVAELESYDSVFAQGAVVHLKARLISRQMLERRVNTIGFGVVIFGVTL